MGSSNSTILDNGHEVTPVQMWKQGDNTRGTFDILWNCAQTILLCAWVSVCVNVPSPKSERTDMLRDKFYFLLLTLLGPDLVFMLAFGQHLSARASTREFKTITPAGRSPWTMVHAFYADMGGINLQPLREEPEDWGRFPVNAKEISYLVRRGYMDYPDIDLSEIQARNKTDGLGRAVTTVNILYFTISSFARVAQGLAITTLELTVLGFILCTLATQFAWWHKPNDVEIGHVFPLKVLVAQIKAEADEDLLRWPCCRTPLDFLSLEPWVGLNLWNYYVNILHHLGLFRTKHREFPRDRFTSFNFPKPGSRIHAIIGLLLAVAYTSTFVAAWNFYFPTRIEQTIWRAISISQIGISLAIAVFEICYLHTPTAIPKRRSLVSPRAGLQGILGGTVAPSSEKVNVAYIEQSSTETTTCHFPNGLGLKQKLRKSMATVEQYWNRPCNNSPHRHSAYDVPLRSLLVTTPLCAAYVLCRWYLLSEDIIGFRSVPPSVYKTVDWTLYLPSFSR